MAPVQNRDTFLDLVRKSGLIESEALEAHLRQSDGGSNPPLDGKKMAAELIRAGLLTPFQARFLLNGRWKNLVLGGKYKLLDLIGKGGMGNVYLCEHVLMKRRLALKVLHSRTKDTTASERFVREARAVAVLDHPNIVRAHDFDKIDGAYFLVMEYVEGVSLHELVKRKGRLGIAQAAHYAAQTAQGLHHAHAHGLVHRDVKPNNLLVDRTGTVKVLDLGLARFFLDTDDTLTQQHDSQAVLGTADYLSPEQALNSSDVDVRTDVYSLGATLYYLLAGHAPFHDGTKNQKLLWHVQTEPKPIEDVRADVPMELAAVLRKMMAKDPNLRYSSAAEVVEALLPWAQSANPVPEDLSELLPAVGGGPASGPGSSRTSHPNAGSQPTLNIVSASQILARPAGPSSAVQKKPAPPKVVKPAWQRKAYLVLAGIVGVLLAGTALGVALWPHGEKPPDPPDNGQLPPPPYPVDPFALKPDEAARFVGHKGQLHDAVFTPDGRQVLTAGQDQTLRLWDPDVGREVRRFDGHKGGVHAVAFLPDARRFLTAGNDKTVRLWDPTRPNPLVRSFEALHTGPVRDVACAADGRHVLSGGSDGARLWDVDTGKETARLTGHKGGVVGVVFARGGRWAITAGSDKTMRLWEVKNGKEVKKLELPEVPSRPTVASDSNLVAFGCGSSLRLWNVTTHEVRVHSAGTQIIESVAFTGDGRHLVCGCQDNGVRLWDVAVGKELRKFEGHAGPVQGVACSPDGRLALSASHDGTARVWKLPPAVAGTYAGEINRFEGHTLAVENAEFSPDGRLVVTTGTDKTVRVWNAHTGEELRAIKDHTLTVRGLAWVPGTRQFATASADKTVRVWNADTGSEVKSLTGHTLGVQDVAASPDGTRLLTGSDDKTARLWDLEKATTLKKLEGHTAAVTAVLFTRDGRHAITGSLDKTIRLWDLQTGKEQKHLDQPAGVWRMALSPDGRWVAFGNGPSARLWDFTTGECRIFPADKEPIDGVAFTPDGLHLLAASYDKLLRVYDVVSGKPVARLTSGHTLPLLGVSLSPDARVAVTTSRDRTARLWRLPSWVGGPALAEVARFDGHPVPVENVVLSPNGRTALSVGHEQVARLWDVATGRELKVLDGHTMNLRGVAFLPDGKRAVTCGNDKTARLWNLGTGETVREFVGHTDAVHALAVSADGKRLLTGSFDKTVRLWDVETGEELKRLVGHEKKVYCVALSKDGKLALSAGEDRIVKVWEVETGKVLRSRGNLPEAVWRLHLSPDGKQVVFGSGERVYLWSFTTNAALRWLPAPGGLGVSGAAFSPNGRYLLTASRDAAVTLWDVETGEPLHRYEGHTDHAWCVAFTPDGRFAVSSGKDKTARVWRLPSFVSP